MKIKICNASTLAELKNFDLASAIRIHGECFVGRSPDVPLVLDSDDVSRQHGKFFIQDGKYHFCDLGSSNGSVINDRVVKANQPYSLNNGDAVHIGDFVLLVEEQQQELAQTVFKVIDPWMFKPKSPEIVVSNPATELPIPEPVASAVEINNPEEIDALPPAVAAVEAESQPSEAAIELIEPADGLVPSISSAAAKLNPVNEPIGQPDSSVATSIEEIENESIDLIEPADEVTPTISAKVPFDPSTQTIVQTTQTIVQTTQTIVQTGHPVAAPISEAESAPTIDAGDRDNLIVNNIELEPLPYDPSTQTIIQRGYPETLPVETSIESAIPVDNLTATNEVKTISVENPDNLIPEPIAVPPTIKNRIQAQSEEISFTPAIEGRVSEKDEVAVTPAATAPTIEETVRAEDRGISLDGVDEVVTSPPIDNNVLQAGIVAGVATVAAVSSFDRTESTASLTVTEEEIMPVEIASPIDSIRQNAINSLSTKQIIAICHDSITPDLIDFIDEHKSFFSKCSLVSWLSISEELNRQIGINLSQAIPSGVSGGYQRIAASINSGEVAAVIFLRDFLQPQAGQSNEESMLRLCNINQILLATNTATAATIVSYLS